MATLPETPHAVDVDELLSLLETDIERGLDDQEAARRREEFGPNRLQETKAISPFQILVRQFKDLMVLILVAAVVIAFLSWWVEGAHGFPADAVVILAIVVANALLGFVQEYQAERTIEELQRSTAAQARVVRNGSAVMVEQEQLVPGDIVVVQEGDRVPADAVLAQSNHLQVNESLLTGESVAVTKETGPVEADATIDARTGSLFAGTTVTAGEGRAVVVRTGSQTELGGIASSLSGTVSEETPLERRLNVLGKQIGWVVLALSVIIGITVLVVEGRTDTETLVKVAMFAVALAVAAVPEGLPAVLTVSLSAGARRLAKRNAVARRMAAVETLGSVTVIVTDKTGTLTHNQMTVRRIFFGGDRLEVSGEGYSSEGEVKGLERPELLEEFLDSAVLANNADLEKTDGQVKAVGDPMDAALLVLAEKAGFDWRSRQRQAKKVSDAPFSSERARVSSLRRIDGQSRLYLKGSLDAIAERSVRYLAEDGVKKPVDEGALEKFRQAEQEFAGHALRTLAFAVREADPEKEAADQEEELTLLGLAAFGDPPRDEVKPALEKCRRAGIRVIMLTGDHPATASAVARQIDLVGAEEQAVTGRELTDMPDERFAEAVKTCHVLARVSPAQKLKVVESLIEQGEVVAMTGDGVNDAPALKKVHVGVAMGRGGTAVAVEASDLVLMDDNFATIVGAIEEGRSVFSNVQRFIAFLFSGNLGVVTAMFVGTIMAGLFDLRFDGEILLPLTAAQILWMNLVTDGAPAVAFALGATGQDVMKDPPRDPRSPILSRRMWSFVATTGLVLAGLFLVVLDVMYAGGIWTLNPENHIQARTTGFYTIVTARLFNSLNYLNPTGSLFEAKTWVNKFVPAASLFSWLLTLGVIFFPPAANLFGLEAIDLTTLGVLTLLIPFVVLIPAEVSKRILPER